MLSFDSSEKLHRLIEAIESSDAIVVGAGSGLSTAAGLTYGGDRFQRYFADFIEKYRFTDMYSAGFYPFKTLEEHWAYWSRHIWYNRYVEAPKDTYEKLLKVLSGKDFFVITTNVDHRFQLSGFPKDRLFYTQGDYGLWQCSDPCHDATYDNYDTVKRMIDEQDGMRVPSDLVPYCPECGRPMTMNLRCDSTFVEDKGWHGACRRYESFMAGHMDDRVLYLELGVGMNTPVIIKYPFWNRTNCNSRAVYACINFGEVYAPAEIQGRSILLDADIDVVLETLLALREGEEG